MVVQQILTYIAGALIVGGFSVYTVRANNRAQAAIKATDAKLDSQRVDGEAYERANTINGQLIEGLKSEITRLTLQLTDLRAELTEREDREDELEIKVKELQDTVKAMKRLLREHDIAIPE